MDKKTSQLVELPPENVVDSDVIAIVNAGQSRKITMGSIFSLVSDLITAAIVALTNSFGVLVLEASAPLLNSIGLAFTNINISDSVTFDKSNGHIDYDFVNNKIIINSNGVYNLSVFGSFTAPQNSVITFKRYKNGAAIGGITPEYVGQGNAGVQIIGLITLELIAGDEIEVRAKSDSADTDLTIINLQQKIEKSHHQ